MRERGPERVQPTAEERKGARRRHWITLLVIVTSVYALAFAIWSPPAATGPGEPEALDATLWWWAHLIGGGLGLGAVLLNLWRTLPARIVLGLGGLTLLAGSLLFQRFDWLVIVALLLPGLIMLAAAPFLGAMPTPEEEGQARGQRGYAPRESGGRPERPDVDVGEPDRTEVQGSTSRGDGTRVRDHRGTRPRRRERRRDPTDEG